MFGARQLVLDRKTSGTLVVPRASVSITGGIQPAILGRAFTAEHRDSGMLARFLLAYPPRRRKRWSERSIGEDVQFAFRDVLSGLRSLDVARNERGEPEPKNVRLTEDARTVWRRFVEDHGRQGMERTEDEAASWSKLEGYAARLALIFHLVQTVAADDPPADAEMMDAETVEAGITLARWFGDEYRRIAAVLTGDSRDLGRQALCDWIRETRDGSATVRDLTHGMRRYRNDPKGAQAALDDLVAHGHADRSQSRGPGRPTERFTLRAC